MKKLGFAHQHCTFHLIKNMTTNLKQKINEELDKYEAELRKTQPKISKNKIKKIRKKKKEEITKEIKEYIELFYELFHQQSFKKAKNYIKLLKQELKNFPKIMQDYLNKNFFPVYKKYLVFLEKPFIKKLESTNNKLENYFGNTLDKHTKRIYRNQTGLQTTRPTLRQSDEGFGRSCNGHDAGRDTLPREGRHFPDGSGRDSGRA